MTIKQCPEDFQVDEVLSDEALATITPRPGRYVVYHLTKRSLSTPQAAADLARRVGQRPDCVSFAGLKDRHASTTQYVAIDAGPRAEQLPRRVQNQGWHAQRVGFCAQPLTHHAIAANRFRIVVRQLDREGSQQMDTMAAELSASASSGRQAPSVLRVVNYFGDQRFGSARHGKGFAGPDLIRGRYEQALQLLLATPSRRDAPADRANKQVLDRCWGRWSQALPQLRDYPEQRAIAHLAEHPTDFIGAFKRLTLITKTMAVESYQSWLWNAMAVETIAEHCLPHGVVYEADDPFGNFLFPAASAIPAELLAVEVPLLSPKTEPQGVWADAARRVMEHEDLKPKDLRLKGLDRPFFGHFLRRLFVEATDFTMTDPAGSPRDPQGLARTLTFTLPRGAYATVVLRALGQ